MVRVAAWQILRSGSTTPMRLVDREASRSGLDDRDRGLLRQIIGTELRRRGTLRAIVKAFTRRPPKPDLAAHYHIGLVQLLFLDRIPHHAAVSTTVDAARRTLGGAKTTNVNGFLRAVIRARVEGHSGDPRQDFTWRDQHFDVPVFRDYEDQPLLWAEDALSMPASLLKRWAKRHGREKAFALARTFSVEPPLSVRMVRGERDAVVAELEAAGCESFPGEHEAILICPGEQTGTVISSAAFQEGRITIQGESALRGAELLGATAGERVLDLCAAPGGKSSVFAVSGAEVTALDRDPRRLARVEDTRSRLDLSNLKLVASDSTSALAEDASFDAVFIDAPCSNTGTLGAHPGARWRFGPKSMKELVGIQTELIRDGAKHVRPGGRMVWSTCSLEPEENGQLVKRFLEEHPEWAEGESHEFLPDLERGPTDGGFAALLTRKG